MDGCSLRTQHKYGFLTNLLQFKDEELQQAAHHLISCYPKDLEPSIGDELIQFKEYVKLNVYAGGTDTECNFELHMFKQIVSNNLSSVFPNVYISLRMYLCLMVSNCSGERSFSALKRIKNYLRSTMKDEKLNYFSLTHIESEHLCKIDSQDIINEFADKKCRKLKILILFFDY